MKFRNKVFLATGLFFAGAAVAGLYERYKLDTEFGVRGRIVKIKEDINGIKIYVKGIRYEDTYIDKAIVHTDSSTRFIKKFTDDVLYAKNLKEDDIIEVIFKNMIKNGDIVEGYANKIIEL